MDQPPSAPVPITAKQRAWLDKQLADWQSRSIIATDQAQAIRAHYESAQSTQSRLTQRLFIALSVIAAIMIAASVLLVIGYNWDAIPKMLKVAMIFTAVAGTFAGSAISYARQHSIAGEILALLGTLFYGCAIWLLAQVFHIQSHYPDGVMWWMIGALVAAWLVQSTIIGVEAAILAAIWIIMEAAGFNNPNYMYWIFAAGIVGLAVVRSSGWLVTLWVITSAIWILSTGVAVWEPTQMTLPILALFACACYMTGSWYKSPGGIARVWQISGMAVLLIPLMLMTFRWAHDDWRFHHNDRPQSYAAMIFATIMLIWSAAGMAKRGLAGIKSDWPILLIAVICFTEIVAVALPNAMSMRAYDSVDEQTMMILYSIITAIFALWLMVRGVKLDRSLSFFTGIIYLLALILVRWIDLFGDMLSSALLFLASGIALFAAAWFWRKRKFILKSEVTHD